MTIAIRRFFFALPFYRKIWYANRMLPFRDVNPTRNFPLVTISLIVINTLVFLYMIVLQWEGGPRALAQFVNQAAILPSRFDNESFDVILASGSWLTIFTSMFLHGGPVHLLGNMLYLWIFGNNVEDIMGPFRYIMFYLLCGVIAAIAQLLLWQGNPNIPMLGASGAIAGVLGGYLVRFPYARVDSCLFLFIYVTVVRLPAMIVLAFWFVIQLFQGTAGLVARGNGGGTAWWAHIGGFLAGMLLVMLFAKRDRNQGYPIR
ncbi:MAG: rhomboid family intramembrane serine protease [Armatimonadota bacterium]